VFSAALGSNFWGGLDGAFILYFSA